MSTAFQGIAATILTFVLGSLLRRLRIVTVEEGDFLLRLVFYVSGPALILMSFSELEITAALAYFPLSALILIVVTNVAALLTVPRLTNRREIAGVAVMGASIMNLGFAYPFVYSGYGAHGFSLLMLIDSANAFITYSWIYYLGCRFGGKEGKHFAAVLQVLKSPQLLAIGIALLLNAMGYKFDGLAKSFLDPLGKTAIPLIMLALGIKLRLGVLYPGVMVATLAIRVGLGFLIGLVLAALLGFEDVSRAVLVISASAPVGYNSVVFASLAGLDSEFAARLVSISILLGVIYVPLLILLL